ncbi:unnamed protein product [Pelagomonas calceolata]|uniref:Ubiquitin-like domain-containing protein n=1 Tax=Pelagomonas calceolata TaxID=35677 RepID=A0A8J2SNL5_9STRA|nr:unnamed protein product [Pelagomonas calceolata]
MWYAATCIRPSNAESMLRFLRLALASGANPDQLFHVGHDPQIPANTMSSGVLSAVSLEAPYSAPRVIDLLIRWGAGATPIRRQSLVTQSLSDGRKKIQCYSHLAYMILNAECGPHIFTKQHLEVAHALLRNGESLDSAYSSVVRDAQGDAQSTGRSEPIEWVLGEKERLEPSLANNANYLAFKALVRQVRAAGSYRSYVIEQRRTCALVRHLAIHDRATTRDGVLNFLARTGERGLFRRVMSYLPPPPVPPRGTPLNICVRRAEDGTNALYYKVLSTTILMKVFRNYAKHRGGSQRPYITQWAFSLPGSPEVLIEGDQSCDDIGLKDGGVIDVMPYDEHPVGLRAQAAAAATAAAAAKQFIEDQQVLRAEEAEEAVAHAAAAEAARRIAASE